MTRRHDHLVEQRFDQPYDVEAAEAGDVTREFWGSARAWQPRDASGSTPRTSGRDDTTGAVRAIRDGVSAFRPRRLDRRDSTGQLRRSRVHGTTAPSGGPLRPDATIGELADRSLDAPSAGDRHDWPDDGHDLDTSGFDEPHGATVESAAIRRDVGHAEVGLTPTDTSPVGPLAARLGVGAVDPLLVRFGAMILVGVLLVPLALALRPGTTDADSVRIESPDAEFEPSGAAPPDRVREAVAGTAERAMTETAAPASESATTIAAAGAAAPSSDQPAVVAPVASPDAGAPPVSAAPPTEPVESDGADGGPTVEVSELRATDDEPGAESGSVVEAATVDESADRVVPDCEQSYEAAPGDSWYRIAEAAGVSPDSVLAQNRATIGTVIFPGDEICLPADATVPDPPAPTSTEPTEPTEPTTTATPTTVAPTTTTAPSPPPPSMSTAEIRQLVRNTFPEDPETALIIVARESNFDPRADNNFCCYGLFQIYFEVHEGWLDDFGVNTATDLFDPVKNVRAARRLYERAGGWSPWGF